MSFVVATVDHVHGADLTDVVGRQEVAVTHGTRIAAGVIRVIVTVATARRVALVAEAARKVTRVVVTVAVPAVVSVTTVTTSSRQPTTALIVMRPTVRRPSHRDRHRQLRRTTRANVKEVPTTDQKMVHRVRALSSPTVAAVADRQLMTTKVGCCSCGVVTFAEWCLRSGHPCDRSLSYSIKVAAVMICSFFCVNCLTDCLMSLCFGRRMFRNDSSKTNGWNELTM